MVPAVTRPHDKFVLGECFEEQRVHVGHFDPNDLPACKLRGKSLGLKGFGDAREVRCAHQMDRIVWTICLEILKCCSGGGWTSKQTQNPLSSSMSCHHTPQWTSKRWPFRGGSRVACRGRWRGRNCTNLHGVRVGCNVSRVHGCQACKDYTSSIACHTLPWC